MSFFPMSGCLIYFNSFLTIKGKIKIQKMSEHLLLLGLPFLAGAEQQPSAQFSNLDDSLVLLVGPPPVFAACAESRNTGLADGGKCDLAKLDPQFETTVQKLLSIMEEASKSLGLRSLCCE